jgi:hypothetical protein
MMRLLSRCLRNVSRLCLGSIRNLRQASAVAAQQRRVMLRYSGVELVRRSESTLKQLSHSVEKGEFFVLFTVGQHSMSYFFLLSRRDEKMVLKKLMERGV